MIVFQFIGILFLLLLFFWACGVLVRPFTKRLNREEEIVVYQFVDMSNTSFESAKRELTFPFNPELQHCPNCFRPMEWLADSEVWLCGCDTVVLPSGEVFNG